MIRIAITGAFIPVTYLTHVVGGYRNTQEEGDPGLASDSEEATCTARTHS